MKNVRNINATITLVMTLVIATTIISVTPIATAQEKQTSRGFISVSPKTIGVTQTLLVNSWVSPPPPWPPQEYYYNLSITFTKPDQTTETIVVPKSDEAGTVWFNYVPDEVGSWSVMLSWAGDAKYEGCESPPFEFTVQQEPVPAYPSAELPENYWQRPINAENREWYTISGDWLQDQYDSAWSNFNPYSEAPESAHILWKKQTDTGGLIGGAFGTLSYEAGYTVKAVMAGKAYYDAPDGIHCLDVHTGEELWLFQVAFRLLNQSLAPFC